MGIWLASSPGLSWFVLLLAWMSFCGQIHSFSFSKYLGAELLSHWLCIGSAWIDVIQQVSEGFVSVCTPTAAAPPIPIFFVLAFLVRLGYMLYSFWFWYQLLAALFFSLRLEFHFLSHGGWNTFIPVSSWNCPFYRKFWRVFPCLFHLIFIFFLLSLTVAFTDTSQSNVCRWPL